MGTTTITTEVDPVYNKFVTDLGNMNIEQGTTGWNLFMYGTEWDPSEEVWVDTETGEMVDDDQMKNPDYVPATEGTQELNPAWLRWNSENNSPRGPSGKPEPEKYAIVGGADAQGEEYLTNDNVTKMTRQEYEVGYNDFDPTSVVSEKDLMLATTKANMELLPGQQELVQSKINTGLLTQTEERTNIPLRGGLERSQIADEEKGIAERAPVRTAFFDSALEGLDGEKYARQAATDAAIGFDKSKAGLFRSMARRGVNPGNIDVANESMARAKGTTRAKTDARNWAETESFNRLETAANTTF